MAQALKPASAASSLARTSKRKLPPLTHDNGVPLLRHDPGVLPPGSNIINYPSQKRPALPESRTANATAIEHGTEIYMYSHVRTNQIVYSLTRHLRSSTAMSQLAYFGKKTRPRALRKDLWLPVLLVRLNNPVQGLEVWQRLGHLKRLHELNYDKDVIREKEGKRAGQLMIRQKRAKVLMDQLAWGVADLGMVLKGLEPKWVTDERQRQRKEEEKKVEKEKRIEGDRRRGEERRKEKERKLKEQPLTVRIKAWWRGVRQGWSQPTEKRKVQVGPKSNAVDENPVPTESEEEIAAREKVEYRQAKEEARKLELKEKLSLEGVEIRWANLRNAGYVEDWPKEIQHATLDRSGYSAAWPAQPKRLEMDDQTAGAEDIKEQKVQLEHYTEEDVPTKDRTLAEESKKPWLERMI